MVIEIMNSKFTEDDIEVVTNSNKSDMECRIEDTRVVVDRMRGLKNRNNDLQKRLWEKEQENKRLIGQIKELHTGFSFVERNLVDKEKKIESLLREIADLHVLLVTR